MMADPFEILRERVARHWGYDTFRPLQEEAMRAALERRDSLVVLPTGAGKSLCFQAPALVDEQGPPVVVISPLIALMKDQVDSLRGMDVEARFVNSSLTADEKVETFNALKVGKVRLLYASPERLVMPSFQDFLQGLGVHSFAIDEAHCISHWGHDFRPEYRQMALLRDRFPEAVFHAFTATATERVRTDIVEQLRLRQPKVLVGNFDRPNLVYRVVPSRDVNDQIMEVVQRHKDEAGIVYCISRKKVEEVAGVLQGRGVNAMPYHAGMDDTTRRRTQDAFRKEKVDVVVATVAFGMGIDRSNVRFVVHASIPLSVEHYQQEAGRAGRDGLEAECLLLFSYRDVMTWKSLKQKSAEEAGDSSHLPEVYKQLDKVVAYADRPYCRHRALVEHFGQAFAKPNCGACDVCLGESAGEEVADGQEIARKLLSGVARTGERYGAAHVVDVLTGVASERAQRMEHTKLTVFGLLKDHDEKTLRNWIWQLVQQRILNVEEEFSILKLTPDAWAVMKNEKKVTLTRVQTKETKRRVRGVDVSWEGVDRPLFEKLRAWRLELAQRTERPPYTIFHDATLREFARRRPTNIESLRKVSGVGVARERDFGGELLKLIREHCGEAGVEADLPPPPVRKAVPVGIWKPSGPAERAFPMIAKGMSLEQIATTCGVARSTAQEYLGQYIRHKKIADVSPWVDPMTERKIEEAVALHGLERPGLIHHQLNGEVPYDAIKVVMAKIIALEEAERG